MGAPKTGLAPSFCPVFREVNLPGASALSRARPVHKKAGAHCRTPARQVDNEDRADQRELPRPSISPIPMPTRTEVAIAVPTVTGYSRATSAAKCA